MVDSELSSPGRYVALGLNIDSEIDLPLPRGARDDVESRVAIRVAPPSRSCVEACSELVANVQAPGGGYDVWRVDGSYVLRLGHKGTIVIEPERACLTLDERSTVLAHVAAHLGLALYLVARGECVLHAASFVWRGRAHAIVGGSGSGKSTLAGILFAAGASVISDDTLRVNTTEPIRCSGGTRALRLRPSASALADLAGSGSHETSVDGRKLLDVPASVGAPSALKSLWFVHAQRERTEPELAPLSRAEALRRLVDGVRVRGLRDGALMQAQLTHLGRLARSLPAFEARLPWGPPFRREWGTSLLDAIERHG